MQRPRQRSLVNPVNQSELLEHPNSVKVEVELVPLQPVSSRNRVGVMVVMPTISETDQRDPPIVGRRITSLKASRTPDMRGRVHDPRRMKSQDGSKKSAPP